MATKTVEVPIAEIFKLIQESENLKLTNKVPQGVNTDHFLFVREAVAVSEDIFSSSTADSITILKAILEQIDSVGRLMAKYGIPQDARFVAIDEDGSRIEHEKLGETIARMRGEKQTPDEWKWKECQECPSKGLCTDLGPCPDALRSGKVENGKLH